MSHLTSNHTSQFINEPSFTPRKYGILFVTLGLSAWFMYSLYLKALPKPIKGMPHHPESARRIMGDLPDLARQVVTSKDLNSWLLKTVDAFDSPVCQIFIRPLASPVVLLSDFREAQDIWLRRKEFDRGSIMRELFRGPTPGHHITLATGDEWKAHRRLLQDLMTPPFLQNVAAPAIYTNVVNLIKLWEEKARIARGRPFDAYQDIFFTALDAVTAFAFGDDFPHRATKPVADLIRSLDEERCARLRHGLSTDDAIEFPTVDCDEVVSAILDVSINIERLHSTPWPVWKWKVIEKFPPLNKTMRVKNDFIVKELNKAVLRQQSSGVDDTWVHSAVDLMVQREKKIAQEDNREPSFISQLMKDELFGVITGGHDTTSTSMLWGLKFLADNPETQTKLRTAMEEGFSAARAEKRNLHIEEIMHINVPYLYAAMEEILRCAGTAPLVEREALCDTTLLGYHIPKGTKVFFLTLGASMNRPAFQIDDAKRSDTYHLAVKNRGEVAAWDQTDITEFKPDRWLKPVIPTEEKNEVNGDRLNMEFDSTAGPQMAFGLGKRSCFGKRLAHVELRILLSLIVWNFEILKCPDALSGYQGKDGVTHKPVKNYVRLRKVVR